MSIEQWRAHDTTSIRDGFHWFTNTERVAVNLEDAELLYALVRSTKPRVVLEAGTGTGISAVFIGTALRDNGWGTLTTYEPVELWADSARKLIGNELPVTVVNDECPDWEEGDLTDFVFIDSGANLTERREQMGRWLTCGYRGLVVIHDADNDYPELGLGQGVHLRGGHGVWIGRAR